MWTEPSFIDVITATSAAQRIVMRRLHPDEPEGPANPLVPTATPDEVLSSLAQLVVARDIRGRLEATWPWDVRPEAFGDRVDFGWGHPIYPALAGTDAYDVDAALTAIEGGRRGDTRALSVPGIGTHTDYANGQGNAFLEWGIATVPRYCCGGTRPRALTPYATSAGTKAQAARIYAAVLAQNTADASIDAGVAASIASNLVAVRATFLTRAQSQYPERGYT